MIIYQDKFPTKKPLKNNIISNIKYALSKTGGNPCINNFDLSLVLDEAILNAMEHGNKWDPGKNIDIKILKMDSGIQIEIKDEGEGFDYLHEFQKPSLDKRGRGIFLIRQMCDIEWTGCGSVIKINIPFETRSQ